LQTALRFLDTKPITTQDQLRDLLSEVLRGPLLEVRQALKIVEASRRLKLLLGEQSRRVLERITEKSISTASPNVRF
jgi:hypothetical protein